MERIGRYELREKLGQGGMGVVYRAFDTLLQRVVAVKVIAGSLEGNPELRERFFREARAAGQLSHPNIITIHDLGEHEAVPYLAMEYLEGEDLQRRMAGPDRMSLSHKLDLAIDICQGLDFAHTHNVVHRDIKPANIFITDNGTVKLLDFGLARLVTSELTQSNMMMGTINYMAPEQVRGERADHRSDIFATGVVFYEMLSGRKAFQGDSFAATLYQILQRVPEPLDRVDSTLPSQMVAIVERALAKPRDERYQQMSEMLRDLLTVRQQLVMSESPTGYRSAFGSALSAPTPLPGPGSGSGGQRPSSGGVRPASGPQRHWSGAERPSSGGGPSGGDFDETGLPSPAPMPLVTPRPAPAGTVVPPATSRFSPLVMAALVVGLAIVGVIGYSMLRRTTPTAPEAAPVAVTRDTSAIQSAVTQALTAFQAGDYAGAARYADSVLLQIPSHTEARRITDRAREAVETIERGLRDARSHFEAGRFDEAAAAAGGVLAVSPAHPDAKRILAESSDRSRGRAGEEARSRMTLARWAAIAAGAQTLAARSYGVAIAAEREAARLQRIGRASDAAAKYYEAGGLFRSAEVAAQTASAVASQRANERPATQPPPQAAIPAPEAPPPALPSVPVAPLERTATTPQLPLPVPPAPAPAAPSAPPAATPPSAPAPDPAVAAAAAAHSAILELLSRYEQALESRSIEALRRIWPSLAGAQQTALRNGFENATRIEVDIVDPQITVSGASATVTFLRRYEVLTDDRQLRRADTPTTATLRRTDGGWVIEQIRFGAAR